MPRNNMKGFALKKTTGFSVHLTNLSESDVAFFDALTKLFCDPANAEVLELVRDGKRALLWDKKRRLLNIEAYRNPATPNPLLLN